MEARGERRRGDLGLVADFDDKERYGGRQRDAEPSLAGLSTSSALSGMSAHSAIATNEAETAYLNQGAEEHARQIEAGQRSEEMVGEGGGEGFRAGSGPAAGTGPPA